MAGLYLDLAQRMDHLRDITAPSPVKAEEKAEVPSSWIGKIFKAIGKFFSDIFHAALDKITSKLREKAVNALPELIVSDDNVPKALGKVIEVADVVERQTGQLGKMLNGSEAPSQPVARTVGKGMAAGAGAAAGSAFLAASIGLSAPVVIPIALTAAAVTTAGYIVAEGAAGLADNVLNALDVQKSPDSLADKVEEAAVASVKESKLTTGLLLVGSVAAGVLIGPGLIAGGFAFGAVGHLGYRAARGAGEALVDHAQNKLKRAVTKQTKKDVEYVANQTLKRSGVAALSSVTQHSVKGAAKSTTARGLFNIALSGVEHNVRQATTAAGNAVRGFLAEVVNP